MAIIPLERLGACPNGYEEETGDLPDWGHPDLGVRLPVQSREECAEICNALSGCLSFEHSDTGNYCNLNDEAMPTSEAYRDQVFCRKFGKLVLSFVDNWVRLS